MVRKVMNLAVFLLIANAVYQISPVIVHHFQFKDSLNELALFSSKLTDAEVVERTMALAQENQIPLMRQFVQVRHDKGTIYIDATYVELLRYLPGLDYPWQFDAGAKQFDGSLGTLR
ncbi:MAG: hypothetical protein ABI818_15340 [Acidobacteriota bacterium]